MVAICEGFGLGQTYNFRRQLGSVYSAPLSRPPLEREPPQKEKRPCWRSPMGEPDDVGMGSDMQR